MKPRKLPGRIKARDGHIDYLYANAERLEDRTRRDNITSTLDRWSDDWGDKDFASIDDDTELAELVAIGEDLAGALIAESLRYDDGTEEPASALSEKELWAAIEEEVRSRPDLRHMPKPQDRQALELLFDVAKGRRATPHEWITHADT